MREDELVGHFSLARPEPEPFTPGQIKLVQTFADQAVIAIENARLFNELRQRTDDLRESLQQQTATADVLKVISRSAFDLKSVLTTLTESAKSLCGATLEIICLRDGEVMRLQAKSGCTQASSISWRPIRSGLAARRSPAGSLWTANLSMSADVQHDPEYNFGQAQNHRRLPGGARGAADARWRGRRRAVAWGGRSPDRSASARSISCRPLPTRLSLPSRTCVCSTRCRRAPGNCRIARRIAHRQDRLVQTEKLASLGQLTAGIAHEIKNPLNFVNNFSALSAELIDELNDVLKPAALDDKVREEIDELTQMLKGNLEKVVQHGKRANSIVKNMLLHSREGSGEHRPADINAIVEESLNLAYHGARAEKSGFNITLRRDLDPAAGMIDLYPQEMTRVFLNLISNGFYAATKRKEAGDEGFEPTLSATTKSLGNKVEIRIRDNGTGIPPEVKEKMFNPFFTTKPAGEGTGLGLSMSHDIVVKQHGGKIEVDTIPGAFTEFIITLPRTAAAQPTGGRHKLSVYILVVDDEPDVEALFRQQFRRDLKSGRFTMEFAPSAPDALARAAEIRDPSLILILSDINMPGMSGLEMLPRVRAERPDVPVIMITAYGDAETRRKAIERGAVGLLTKPIDFALLRQEIDVRLGQAA